MNKNCKVSLSIGISLILLSSTIQASNGTLTIVGKLTNSTCRILGAAGEGDTPSQNSTIKLFDIYTERHKNSTYSTPFYIYFRECDLFFHGMERINVKIKSANPNDTFALSNMAEFGSKEIFLTIMHDSSIINFDCLTCYQSPSRGRHKTSRDPVIRYDARYYTFEQRIKSGPFIAIMNYEVNYN